MSQQYGTKSQFLERVSAIHNELRGISRDDARGHYIREGNHPDHPHNLHLYHLKRKKSPSAHVILALCNKGIDIFEVRF